MDFAEVSNITGVLVLVQFSTTTDIRVCVEHLANIMFGINIGTVFQNGNSM